MLLSDSGFRRLYATRLAGQACDGVFQASLAGFVLFSPERATTASSLAAAAAVLLLPYSFVGPVAGVVIDRVTRARILVVANLIRAVIVIGVGLIILAGNAGVPFYAAALLAFAVNRFILSALSASLPGVTPADQLVTANSLSTTSGTLATVVGAGIGAGIAALISAAGAGHDPGQAGAAFVGAAGYALAALVAGSLPAARLGPHDRPTDRTRDAVAQAFRDLAAGAVYLWRHRIARDALAAQTSHRFFYGLWTVTAVLLERNLFEHHGGIFHGGAAGLGELVVVTGAGSVTAALVTPWIAHRVGTQAWITLALVVGGGGLVALGLPYQTGSLVAAALLLGFVGQATKVCTDTIVQRTIEDAYRGRAFAFYDQLFNVAYVAAAAAGAALLPTSGRSVAILSITGTGYVLTGMAFAAATAQHRMTLRR
jgi:MFS family permease